MALLLVGLLGSSLGMPAAAQFVPPPLFQDILLLRNVDAVQELPAFRFSAAAWGDYDGDADFDLFIMGRVAGINATMPFSQLYLNMGDTQIQSNPEMPLEVGDVPVTAYADAINVALPIPENMSRGAVAWGDYDNDGDLDILATGVTASGSYVTHLYENVHLLGTFPAPGADRLAVRFTWPGVRDGDVAWSDYDNDGDLDFIIAGTGEDGRAVTALYENQVAEGGGFMPRNDPTLVGLHVASVAWGDYDNDGDHDLLMTGISESQAFLSRLYRNEGNGVFSEAQAGLKGLAFASAAWGDYDADGDLDLLISGAYLHPFILQGEIKVYENSGGAFIGDAVTLEGAFEDAVAVGRYQGSVGWGDYNNDGYLDFVVSGIQGPQDVGSGEVYRYAGNNHFTNVPTGGAFPNHRPARFTGGLFGATFWGDYDNDHDLDLFIVGDQTSENVQVVTLRNYLDFVFPPNTPPGAPGGLQATPQGTSVTLRWEAAQDAQTPAPGLSYNLRVGTSPGGVDVLSPMAVSATGQRLLAATGNAGLNLQWSLENLAPGTYYWSVQAIDASFKGSPFAEEGTFTIP